jgi:hypothetical protein
MEVGREKLKQNYLESKSFRPKNKSSYLKVEIILGFSKIILSTGSVISVHNFYNET